MEYEVVGHGHFGETWGIEKGIIMGRPDSDEVWARIDDLLDHVYRFKNGVGLKISTTFVDEGGHFTQDVRLLRLLQKKTLLQSYLPRLLPNMQSVMVVIQELSKSDRDVAMLQRFLFWSLCN